MMSHFDSSRVESVLFGGATPILRVGSLDASVDFYVRLLGFEMDWQSPGILASVSRGRCQVFLCEGDQGNPGTWLWIGVSDIEPLFSDYSSRGVVIGQPPTGFPWAYEMQVQDPDGNVLRFGSEARTDLPLGDWLDMRGVRWRKSTSGQWVQVSTTN